MLKKHLILVPSELELLAVMAGLPPVMTVSKGPYQIHMVKGRTDGLLLCCGIGTAYAAAAAAFAVHSFAVGHITVLGLGGFHGPEYIPAQAVSGSSEVFLRLGSISSELQYDSLVKRMKLSPPLAAVQPQSLPLAVHEYLELPQMHFGTADQIAATREDLAHLDRNFPEVRVENMEGAAVATVAMMASIPCSSVRVLCNRVGNRDFSTWDIKPSLQALTAIAGLL
jgi:nucleoside phosphorylase